MQGKRLLIILLTAVVFIALSAGFVVAGGTPTISSFVIGGGGGKATAGIYTLEGTIGQPVVGVSSNASYEVSAGFWSSVITRYDIYLPIVLRGH